MSDILNRHRETWNKKKILREIYTEWYHQIILDLFKGTQKTVELGAGSGNFKEFKPDVVSADIDPQPWLDMVFDAHQMPFKNEEIANIVMIDVLHHIPDVRAFFAEAVRCLKPRGRIAMIEPANTVWSRFIYTNFHHEGFDPQSGWEFESKGPLSTANGALPWIIFHRDRTVFESDFPSLKIIKTQFHTPLRYLLSGGFTLRQLTPSWSYCMVNGLEALLSPLNRWIGMFETIVVEKNIQ